MKPNIRVIFFALILTAMSVGLFYACGDGGRVDGTSSSSSGTVSTVVVGTSN